MGIDINSARILGALGAKGLIRGKVAMLGRQNILFHGQEMLDYLEMNRIENPTLEKALQGLTEGDFAEDFLRRLGASVVDSIDVSSYEGATVILDLNKALNDREVGPYDLVFDGGTLEHVFNIGTAVDNVRKLLRPGSIVVSIGPGNNYCGHGFYQFSPEFYFRSFGEASGFGKTLLFAWETRMTGQADVYAVVDPAEVGRRCEFRNARPLMFCCLAQMSRDAKQPACSQQSDYVAAWHNSKSGEPLRKVHGPQYSRFKRFLVRNGHTWIKALTPARWRTGNYRRIVSLEKEAPRVAEIADVQNL